MTIIKVNTRVGTAITKLTKPLGDNNWTAWRTRIVSALKVCCVMEYVQGGIPIPDAENPAEDLEAWNFNDSYAQTIILNNILDNQLVHAQSAKNAKEMWNNLASVHDAKGHYVAISIQQNLLRTCANEGDDITEHLNKLKKLWERLNTMDDDDFRISDNQFKTILASSLPPSWDIYTDPYISKRKDPDENGSKRKIKSQDFIGILIEEYRRQQD